MLICYFYISEGFLYIDLYNLGQSKIPNIYLKIKKLNSFMLFGETKTKFLH